MKLLRVGILCLFVSVAFAQRGGSHGGGGGFSRGGGGGGFSRGGGGFSHGGGGFSRGFSGGGFRGGSGFSRGGFNRGFGFRGGGSRFAFGLGFGYPYYGYGYGYGWGYPGYYDYYPYSYSYPSAYYGYPSYYDAGYGSAPVVVNQTYAQPNPAPSVQTGEYPPQYQQPNRETLYLIAFRDHRIFAAIAYWVEGDTLHYVTREHEQGQVALDGVDRAFSEQLNRDRHVEFRLPR
jgi:hypothetical protein